MKTVPMLALLIATSTLSFAQSSGELTVKGSRMTTKDSTPQQVIDTLLKRFPNAEAVQYYKTSSAVANGWAASSEDDVTAGSEAEYYTLKFKRHDFQYYALLKADGTLVKSEFQQNDVELPEVVIASIKKLAVDKNYTDYMVISKTYYKYVDHDKNKEFYEVIAIKKTDASQMKTVIVDAAGNIVKVK